MSAQLSLYKRLFFVEQLASDFSLAFVIQHCRAIYVLKRMLSMRRLSNPASCSDNLTLEFIFDDHPMQTDCSCYEISGQPLSLTRASLRPGQADSTCGVYMCSFP